MAGPNDTRPRPPASTPPESPTYDKRGRDGEHFDEVTQEQMPPSGTGTDIDDDQARLPAPMPPAPPAPR